MEQERDNYLLQFTYSKIGRLRKWAEADKKVNRDLLVSYPTLLLKESLLPQPDQANGFVFYSASANQGNFEYTMAQAVDASLSQKSPKPPLFIAGDIFGHSGDEMEQFEPGFVQTEAQKASPLKHVHFTRISADARHIPLQDGSVDVVWDRLGALWHVQSSRIVDPDLGSVGSLLSEYSRVLRPGGNVVIDAEKPTPSASKISTSHLLRYDLPKVRQLGWDMRFIGADRTRLLVLSKKSQ